MRSFPANVLTPQASASSRRSSVIPASGMSCERYEFRAGNKHRTNDQIVCLLRRGYRVDGAFLPKCVRAPRGDGGRVQGLPLAGPTRPPTNCSFSTMGFGAPLELPPTTPGQPHRRQWDGGSLRMHWRCRRSAFAPHCGLRTALSMRNEHSVKFMPRPPLCPSCAQIMRLARTVSRFGDLPELYIFECRACGVSHIEAVYIEAA